MDISQIVQWSKDLCAIAAFASLLIRPAREWLLGTGDLREGQRCLLRAEIVRIYYRHLEDRQLKEYEYNNMEKCYEAYKALKGNSFIDRLHREMLEWDIM